MPLFAKHTTWKGADITSAASLIQIANTKIGCYVMCKGKCFDPIDY